MLQNMFFLISLYPNDKNDFLNSSNSMIISRTTKKEPTVVKPIGSSADTNHLFAIGNSINKERRKGE